MRPYTLEYRILGEKRWNKLERVVGDGIENGVVSIPVKFDQEGKPIEFLPVSSGAKFRWFKLECGEVMHFPFDMLVHFHKDREDSIAHSMSKSAGQPIQMA